MRCFKRRPDLITEVKWYFVPDDAPDLGLTTVFGSQVWERKELPLAVGEDLDYHPYFRGGPPPFLHLRPLGLCGTPQQWLEGCNVDDPLPAVDPNTGIRVCCGRGALLPAGGLALGGEAQVFVVDGVAIGGLAVGGEALVSLTLRAAGGLALGGEELVSPNWIARGGLAVGGQATTGWFAAGAGGIVAGGEALVSPNWIARGGLAVGGQGLAAFAGSGAGGLAVGAELLLYIVNVGLGGLAVGGQAISYAADPASGGLAVGGTSIVFAF